MKKFPVYLLVLTLSLLYSCSGDGTNGGNIVGKWKIVDRIQDDQSNNRFCDEYLIIEYDNNLVMTNYLTENTPTGDTICPTFYLVQWGPIEKIDDNNYTRVHQTTDAIINYTVNGNVLTKEQVFSNIVETLERQ